MTVRLAGSLDEVNARAWDSLVRPLGFYASHDWLRSQERSAAATVTYVLVEQDGDLVAAAPVYEFAAFAEPAAPASAGTARLLRAGPRTGYHNQLLVRAEDERAAGEQAAALVRALADLAAERGRDAILFDHLTTADLALLDGGVEARAALRGAEGAIHNDGGTFESYVRLLGRNARKKEYEWRRFADAGFRVDVVRLSECVDEVVPLIASTGNRYDAGLPEEEIRRYLSEQARCADDASAVFRCFDADGRLVGCSVCFRWQDTLYARVAGFDYTGLRDAFEYFNTVYYEPLRYMEIHGLRTLHLGVASLEAKVRRGAAAHPQWACVIPVPLTPGVLRAHDATADRALADSIAQGAASGMHDHEWSADAFSKITRSA
ncbi:GNAT family N-acetyltransferase [Lentzea sp. NPDC058450]|uniref:GNAT family N-acetyltransferase n=1 Tax=Lentzea sp. NPDC058450 TaxID=3346505 RepID=UPI0036582840